MDQSFTPTSFLLMMANHALGESKHHVAVTLAELALQQAEAASSEEEAIAARFTLGLALCIMHRDREAAGHLSRVVEACRRSSSPVDFIRGGIACGHLVAGGVRTPEVRLEACLRLATEHLALAESARCVPVMISLLTERGRVHEARADLDHAIEDQEKALELRDADPHGAGYSREDMVIRLAGYCVARGRDGDFDHAKTLLGEAEASGTLTHELLYRWGRVKAALAVKEGRSEVAERELRQALLVAGETQGKGLLLVLSDMAKLFVDLARLSDAEEALRSVAQEVVRCPVAACASDRYLLLTTLVRLRLAQAWETDSPAEAQGRRDRARWALNRLAAIAGKLDRQCDTSRMGQVQTLRARLGSDEALAGNLAV